MLFIRFRNFIAAAPLLSLGLSFAGQCSSIEASSDLRGLVTSQHIKEAVQYPGPNAEKKLKDLLKADFHHAQARYYLNREKSGFMAKERFELAHDRALGDIRLLSAEKDDTLRQEKALHAWQSWLGGFKRARIKDIPS